MTGIYFLLHRKKIVYVGATTRYPVRIAEHRKDKVFTKHRFIECEFDKMADYEYRWVCRFSPKYNKDKSKNYRKPKPKRDRIKFGLYLDQTLVAKAEKAGQKDDRSINYMVEKALEEKYSSVKL